jgi:hypothetical protein
MVDRLGPAVGSATASAGLSAAARLFRVTLRAMIGRPVTAEVVLLAPTFGLSPAVVTLVASLFVNSPNAARFLVTPSCFDPATTRLVPAAACFPSTLPVVVVDTAAFLPKTVDAVDVVLLMLGFTGTLPAVEIPGFAPTVLTPERDRVVGAFSSVSVLRAGTARVRRVYERGSEWYGAYAKDERR